MNAMSMNHLTDRAIQQYVLQKAACDADLIEHIRQCEACRQKAQVYGVLFNGISEQEKPVFDFDLSALVLSQLPPVKAEDSVEKVLVYFVVSMALFGVSAVFYLVGNDWLNRFATLTPMLMYLLLTTAGCLFLFLFRVMYTEFQQKMKILNFS
jgi:hypothetical protein